MTESNDHNDAVAEPGPEASERAENELAHDRRAERLLFWKGLVALLFVLLVAYIRHVYFL